MSGSEELGAFTASELRVSPIEARLASRLVVTHHYLHRKPPISFAFGLWRHADLLAVCTFGVPASHETRCSVCPTNPTATLELNRLWIRDTEPRNTATWFVSRALHALPPRLVFSYADTREGHEGYVYRALGWRYAGWTDMERKTPRIDHVPAALTEETLLGTVTRERHTRESSRSGISERRYRKPKARYWTATGTRRDRRRLAALCGWPSLDWHEHPVPEAHRQLT